MSAANRPIRPQWQHILLPCVAAIARAATMDSTLTSSSTLARTAHIASNAPVHLSASTTGSKPANIAALNSSILAPSGMGHRRCHKARV